MPPPNRGTVLIAVLWVCAVISWIALAYASKARFDAEEERGRIERTKGVFLALSGAHEAIARMANQNRGMLLRDDARLKPDGKPRRIDCSTGFSLVRVENELDKININQVERDEIERVLSKAGYEEDAAKLAFQINANLRPRKGDGVVCSPCGPIDTIEQMVLYSGVSADMFYGDLFQVSFGDKWPQSEIKPLFSLFTVVGDRRELPTAAEKAGAGSDFEDNGVYRIVSVGRVSESSAAAAVWLVVKLSSNSRYGYELLYRKVL